MKPGRSKLAAPGSAPIADVAHAEDGQRRYAGSGGTVTCIGHNQGPPLEEEEQRRIPEYCDRRSGARLIKDHYGIDVSPRTMERWPIPSQRVNGRRTMKTRHLFAYVDALISAAPVIG